MLWGPLRGSVGTFTGSLGALYRAPCRRGPTLVCGTRWWRCAVLKDRGGVVSRLFPVALARGKHLFPFRTEQLSPSAPMVLGSQGPGRVGRRRFFRYAAPPRRG